MIDITAARYIMRWKIDCFKIGRVCMSSKKWKKEAIFSLIRGILTLLFRLAAADGMDCPPAGKHIKYMGAPIFRLGVIALPLIFHKRVKRRYALLNLLLYFPIYNLFGLKNERLFLVSHCISSYTFRFTIYSA